MLRVFVELTTFGLILGPGRDPKITKKRPRSENVATGSRFFAFFVAVSRFSQFSTDFRSIFEGPDPYESIYICVFVRFCTFQKIVSKKASGDPFWEPKLAKIDAGEAQNRKIREKK